MYTFDAILVVFDTVALCLCKDTISVCVVHTSAFHFGQQVNLHRSLIFIEHRTYKWPYLSLCNTCGQLVIYVQTNLCKHSKNPNLCNGVWRTQKTLSYDAMTMVMVTVKEEDDDDDDERSAIQPKDQNSNLIIHGHLLIAL